MKLCIGIITYNRIESLQKLVGQIKSLTASSFDLIVSEGGGTDGTVHWCIENGVRVVTGPNLGIARSKNLVLYYFLNHTDCDQVIILEDDCRVWERGWEQEWMLACKAWEHVNWPICPTQEYEHGVNTPGSPIRTNWFGGQCTISSRSSLEKVGYLDPRFIGYGGEHAEWTWRFYRLLKNEWGEPSTRNGTVPCLSSHVGVEFQDSLFNKEGYKKNMALMYSLMETDQSIYRDPWNDDEDKAIFLSSVKDSLTVKIEPFGASGARCPICGSIGVPVGERDGIKIRNCCGVLLSWAWTCEEEYNNFYLNDSLYHKVQQEEEGQRPYWERDGDLLAASFMRLEWLSKLRPRARTILDIGAGTGAFVAAATRQGYTAIGIEPNPDMCSKAEAMGRKISRGTWKEAHWRYDIVAMMDVFEHLTRPRECLERLKEHIAPGGVLYLEMPEAGCPQHVRDGLNWKHIRPKQHPVLYTDTAARRLFYLCGYEVEFSVRPLQGSIGKIAYGLSLP